MRCANDLRSLGVEKGGRVCISMPFAPVLIVVAGHNIGTADALKENVIKAFVSLRVGASPSSGLIDDLEG
jgi:acyl-coenzyme A synthetase/AMP-(fatty) acid ligase